jgi:hypothetical protein
MGLGGEWRGQTEKRPGKPDAQLWKLPANVRRSFFSRAGVFSHWCRCQAAFGCDYNLTVLHNRQSCAAAR